MSIFRRFSIPVAEALQDYHTKALRKDVVAGLTVALLAVPQCMAYAIIAGLKPVYGLYAGIVGAFVGSALGSSRMMITGPTGTLCLVVGGVLYGVDTANPISVAMVLALMVGTLQIIFALLRLGNLARFVSNAVMTGFIIGGGLVIMGDQVINLLGTGSSNSPFFIQRFGIALNRVFQEGYQLPYLSISLGGATIVLVYVLRNIHERIPAGLIAVILGGLFVYLFGLHSSGRIETVSEIKTAIPSFVLPSFDPQQFMDLFSGALAVTLLATIQAVSISKSLASQTLDSIDENQDLMGQGMSNLACGLFSGFPVTGSLSRSFFNHSVGAETRMSGILTSLSMGALILFTSALMAYIPKSVLYGLIIIVMTDVFDWEEIKIALSATRRDQVAFLSTLIAVLVLKLDWAIYAGVAVSLVLYIHKATRLDLKEYIVDQSGKLKQITDYEDRIRPNLALIDVTGEAFFGSADQIKERIQKICAESDRIKVIILRMKNAMDLDITGAMVLKEIALMLKEQGKTLMISGATPEIREVLDEAGVAEVIGEDKILVAQKSLLVSSKQAFDRAQAHIDAVLEGSDSRENEEDPPLQHTMERLEEEIEEKGEDLDESEENPVREEKVQPPADEEISDEE